MRAITNFATTFRCKRVGVIDILGPTETDFFLRSTLLIARTGADPGAFSGYMF